MRIEPEIARTPKQLGNLIRRARRNLGLSQTQLGERTGLRQATISQIEAGKSATRLDSLLKTLATLELEIRIAPRSMTSASDIEAIF
ncbi:MAG: transcriptional regulator [Alphaproteobacteria bacterium]|nr:transcriptional regulator [Alphaproteobacteria bacterium]